ncbi:MAG: recombinase family protein [Eubacteriales bacterium]
MNIVIYARYSSASQSEQSIEGQLESCYDYAERSGYNVVEYIEEPAIIGRTQKIQQKTLFRCVRSFFLTFLPT